MDAKRKDRIAKDIRDFLDETNLTSETWKGEHATWRMAETVPVTVTQPGDLAYHLLFNGIETTPVVHKRGCYICEDSEFAQMGLPLCRKCPACGGHIAADDSVCDICGLDELAFWQVESEGNLIACFSTGYPEYERRQPTEKQLRAAVKAFNDVVKQDD